MPAESPEGRAKADAAQGLQGLAARAAEWFAGQLKTNAGKDARAYLERRGVSPTLAGDFMLGFAPDSRSALKAALSDTDEAKLVEAGLLGRADDNSTYDRFRKRLIFPIRDARGRTVGFGGRALGDAQPKYLNSADGPLFDKGRLLYNLDRALPAARKADRLIIVEGYMDVIGLASGGITEAVAPLGTALTEHQLALAWKAVPEPTLCFDGDAAGQRAAWRAALRALPLLVPGQSLRIATLPTGMDPDDIIAQGGSGQFEKLLKDARSLHDFLWERTIAANDVTSPDGRAQIKKKLKEVVGEIKDRDLKIQYDLLFRERFWTRFESFRSGPPGGIVHMSPRPAAKTKYHLSLPDRELMCVITGLINYPEVALSYLEQVSALPITSSKQKIVVNAILNAVTWSEGIGSDDLEATLRSEGFGELVSEVRKAATLPFRFVPRSDPSSLATGDLEQVLLGLLNIAQIDDAIAKLMINYRAGMKAAKGDPVLDARLADLNTEIGILHAERREAIQRLSAYGEATSEARDAFLMDVIIAGSDPSDPDKEPVVAEDTGPERRAA